MTSRRSRLKAVTNLPVRRKINSSQESGNEITFSENLISEKVFPSELRPDKVIEPDECAQPNLIAENSTTNDPDDSNIDESVVLENSTVSEKSNQTSVSEYEYSKSSESDTRNLESTDNLSVNCNLSNFNTQNSSFVFKSNKRFKPNLVSSSREKFFTKKSETIKENGSSEQQYLNSNNNNYNNINNNNNNNHNVSVIEENFKCYTLLSPHNVALSPLAEYTITPLTPCMNTFNETTVSDLSFAQDFEEVQIFTEVETTEFYENNGNVNDNDDDDCESVIETESLEPVLTNLTNCNNKLEESSSSFVNLNSNNIEPISASENSVLKQSVKSRVDNFKTGFSKQDENLTNYFTQIRDTNIVESGVPSGVSNAFSDFPTLKKNVSAVKRKRSKCNDLTKKVADAKREFQKKYEKVKPDRSTLKMIDLIFYNPTTNPMESKAKFEKKDTSASPSDEIGNLLAEECVDEPEASDSTSSSLPDKTEADNASKMPVPQVKIGLDGEIILDEKSLIIETTDAKKRREHLQNSVPVFEDRGCKVSYYRGKNKKTKDWADSETKKFYKALNTIGPDFTLMQKYFPKRSRLELKNKFKREERLNRNLIDKALNNPSEFDMTQLEKDLAAEKEAEEEIEMKLCRILKHTPRKPRVKSSVLSREMIESDGESENFQSKSFSANSKKMSESEKSKKEKEFAFVFQKLLMKESEQKSRSVLPEISSFKKAFIHSDHSVT